MKLIKKMISAVAVASMVISAFAAMTVQAANPTLTGTATVSDDKSTVSIKVAYNGADEKMKAAGLKMLVDETKFDITKLTENEYDLGTLIGAGVATSNLTTNQLSYMLGNYASGKLIFAFSSGSTLATKTLPASCDNYFTITLPILDSSVLTEGYTFTISEATLGTPYSQRDGTLDVTSPVIEASKPGPEPGPEPGTDPVIPDPVVGDNNATQINGSNEAGKFTFVGDTANDFAVGFGKAFKVTDLEGKSKIRWEITNNAGSWYNEVAIPALASFEDANVRVGIVVQSGVKADLDTITGATAVLQ